MKNRHPADDLADVRAEIKHLEEREVLNGANLRGVEWSRDAGISDETHWNRTIWRYMISHFQLRI